MNIILFENGIIPDKISIKDEKGRHIIKILKLKEGDMFNCGMVNGPSGIGIISSIDKEWIHFSWKKDNGPESLHPLTLLIGYTRPISSKRILREAASLGVERLIFIGTDTGEKSYRDSNLWKGEYRHYLLAGAQQAASTGLPDVLFYRDILSFIRGTTDKNNSTGDGINFYSANRIVLDNVEPDLRLSEYLPGSKSCLLAIGSERGWSTRERNVFREQGYVFVSLGSRVLRTETASTAGITLMLARMGLI